MDFIVFTTNALWILSKVSTFIGASDVLSRVFSITRLLSKYLCLIMDIDEIVTYKQVLIPEKLPKFVQTKRNPPSSYLSGPGKHLYRLNDM